MNLINKIDALNHVIQTSKRDVSNLAFYYPIPELLATMKDIIETAEGSPEFKEYITESCIIYIIESLDNLEEPEPEDLADKLKFREKNFKLLQQTADSVTFRFKNACNRYGVSI